MNPDPSPVGQLAAIAWALDPGGRLLLVRHRRWGWSCPGGHVEPGEEPAVAAARELFEETGVRGVLRLAEPITSTIRLVDGKTRRTLGFVFDADLPPVLSAEPGQPAAWFALDDLPSPRLADIDAVVRRGFDIVTAG